MDIINPMHFPTVAIVGTTPLMMPILVDCLSPIGKVDSVGTCYASGYRETSSSTGNCPCAANPGRAAPSFVGIDFFCESGAHSTPSGQWYLSNPLWDGKGCYRSNKCCSPSRAPWFFKALPVEATSDIEVRLCKPAGTIDKTDIEQLEIYVF